MLQNYPFVESGIYQPATKKCENSNWQSGYGFFVKVHIFVDKEIEHSGSLVSLTF